MRLQNVLSLHILFNLLLVQMEVTGEGCDEAGDLSYRILSLRIDFLLLEFL